MEPSGVTVAGSTAIGAQHGEAGLDLLQFGEEIQRLMAAPPESGSSFTALLELPAPQAMELLHHAPDSDRPPPTTAAAAAAAVNLSDEPLLRKPSFPSHHHHQPFSASNLTFLSNLDLIERAAKYSVFAGEHSPETSSVPSNSSANLDKVKNEPAETDSNPNSSQPPVSDPTAEEKNQRPSAKRKEREKKVNKELGEKLGFSMVSPSFEIRQIFRQIHRHICEIQAKASAKKSKNESSQDAGKLPYVHVRARRGQATDSHSLAERARREKINARMKLLQELVPGCNKISGTALVLDEIINHVQSLQRQVEFLSMRLAAVNPRIDFNLDSILPPDNGSVMDGNLPSMVSPMLWPDFSINESRQQFQQQWNFDFLHQPLLGRDEDNQTFVTPENSLLTYDSTANSASLHSSQLKMEL